MAAVAAMVPMGCERDAEPVVRRRSDSAADDVPLEGRVTLVPERQRQEPVRMSGHTLDGGELSLSNYQGAPWW